MTKSVLKIGIIGAGRMGLTHHCIVNSRAGVQVTAVADPSPIVTKLLSKYAGVRTYKDAAGLLAKESLDAVLVCTPPALNHDILVQVADKGVHAFVEKPYTLNAQSARDLADRFRAKRLVTQVGYINRFNDIFSTVKEILEEGLIGKVIRFRSEMFSPTIIRDPGEEGWRTSHANGGGAVYEMASHAIDLINYLIGKPDRVTGTSLTKVFSRNVEDIVSSTFLYRSGVTGSIYVNWSDVSFRKPTNKFEIFGDAGKILADQHGMKVFVTEPNLERKLTKGWNQLYITDVFTPVPFYLRGFEFTSQLYDFIDHVQRHDLDTRCTFGDGADALEVIDGIFSDYEQTQKALA